jgi:hypothetical protein
MAGLSPTDTQQAINEVKVLDRFNSTYVVKVRVLYTHSSVHSIV